MTPLLVITGGQGTRGIARCCLTTRASGHPHRAPFSSPVMLDGRLYVIDDSAKLRVFDTKTMRSTRRRGDHITPRNIVEPETILKKSADGFVNESATQS